MHPPCRSPNRPPSPGSSGWHVAPHGIGGTVDSGIEVDMSNLGNGRSSYGGASDKIEQAIRFSFKSRGASTGAMAANSDTRGHPGAGRNLFRRIIGPIVPEAGGGAVTGGARPGSCSWEEAGVAARSAEAVGQSPRGAGQKNDWEQPDLVIAFAGRRRYEIGRGRRAIAMVWFRPSRCDSFGSRSGSRIRSRPPMASRSGGPRNRPRSSSRVRGWSSGSRRSPARSGTGR
jgi:hypothetical protein